MLGATAGTPLDNMSSHQFNDQRMKAMLPKDVWDRFRDARAAGEDVTKDDMDAISVRFASSSQQSLRHCAKDTS